MACGQALPHADNFFSGEAPPSRRWHRRHRESQSLPLEWNQIQGELRQQRASFDRRANRKGACSSPGKRHPAASPAQGFDSLLEPRAPYLDALEKLVDWKRLRHAKLRFVFDPMHGAAAGLLTQLLGRNGIPCDEIRGTRDPRFGGVHADRTAPHVAALEQAALGVMYNAALC